MKYLKAWHRWGENVLEFIGKWPRRARESLLGHTINTEKAEMCVLE